METGGSGDPQRRTGADAPPADTPGGPPTVGAPVQGAAQAPAGALADEARTLSQSMPRSSSGVARAWLGFLPIGTAVLIAVVWFIIGGLPFSDHDEHGIVVVERPDQQAQQAIVDLPDGERYVYFEESGLSENDSAEKPEGLDVSLRPLEGKKQLGEPVEIESVPGFLFSVQTNDTGWEPYGKIDVEEGRYLLDAVAPSAHGRVTIGNPPINPFGPPIVGSILILLLGVGLTGLLKGWFRRS